MYRVSSTSPAATGPARGFSASPSASQLAGRPGKIPLVGRLLSPERGGGMFFAAKYVIRGPCADADVRVSPLAAVTPGFLRGLFGAFDPSASPGAPPGRQTPGPR